MIAIRPAKHDDLENCKFDAVTQKELPDIEKAQVELIDVSDSAFTCYDDETQEIYAIMGIDVDGPIGHSWAVFAEKMPSRKVGIRVVRFGQHILSWAQKEYHLSMIDMAQIAGYPKHQRWAKLLGFQYVATLAGFGDEGEDYLYYARHWK